MAKLTGFNRKRIGHRNYKASFYSPPTAVDEYGQQDLANGTWLTVFEGWWCELIDLAGGEVLDGVELRSQTTRVAIGEASPIKGVVKASHKCIIDGEEYGITAVRDVAGDNFTVRVELKATA